MEMNLKLKDVIAIQWFLLVCQILTVVIILVFFRDNLTMTPEGLIVFLFVFTTATFIIAAYNYKDFSKKLNVTTAILIAASIATLAFIHP